MAFVATIGISPLSQNRPEQSLSSIPRKRSPGIALPAAILGVPLRCTVVDAPRVDQLASRSDLSERCESRALILRRRGHLVQSASHLRDAKKRCDPCIFWGLAVLPFSLKILSSSIRVGGTMRLRSC